MSRIAYVNGRYLPFAMANIHIEDRGYQFADGVYEVIAYRGDHLIDGNVHLDRLERSLREVMIDMPMSRNAMMVVAKNLIRLNLNRSGILYIQISRGVARRDHSFPTNNVKPSLVMTARLAKFPTKNMIDEGVSVVSLPDTRWKRCDIKAVGLLSNVLSKQHAKKNGAFEAWLVDDDGFVTEGTSTNAWIVTKNGEITTHSSDNSILNGITRQVVAALAVKHGMKVVERSFSITEAQEAVEAFLTSTTSYVLPVTIIDGRSVNDGKPGKISKLLRQACEKAIIEQCRGGID